MRVLFVSHSFPPEHDGLANVGGMQRVAVDLAEHLRAHSDVALATHVLRAPWRWIVPRAVPFITGLIATVPTLASRHAVDVVLFSSITTALPAPVIARWARPRGVRLMAIAHGLDVTEPNAAYQRGVRGALSALDAVLPVSRATGQRCIERGMPASRVRVVPNGVDLARFAGVAQHRMAALEARANAPAPAADAPFVLLGVGRQVARKGFAWFVDNVMPRLAAHVELVLAGSGPEAETIAQAVERHGLRDRVRLMGMVDDATLMDLYARADIFVMPNIEIPGDMEGFGIVMLEAGACALTTLASDLEGIRDVIVDGASGRMIQSGVPGAWVKAITALAADRSALDALHAQTLAHVRASFSWTQVAERYVSTMADITPRCA